MKQRLQHFLAVIFSFLCTQNILGMNGYCGGYEAGLYNGCNFRFLIAQKKPLMDMNAAYDGFPRQYERKAIINEPLAWAYPLIKTGHSQGLRKLKFNERLPTICELCAGGTDGFPLRGHTAARCVKRFDAGWQSYIDARLGHQQLTPSASAFLGFWKKCFCLGR